MAPFLPLLHFFKSMVVPIGRTLLVYLLVVGWTGYPTDRHNKERCYFGGEIQLEWKIGPPNPLVSIFSTLTLNILSRCKGYSSPPSYTIWGVTKNLSKWCQGSPRFKHSGKRFQDAYTLKVVLFPLPLLQFFSDLGLTPRAIRKNWFHYCCWQLD